MISEHAQMESDFERDFAKKTWAPNTVKELKNFIRRQLDRMERAYGGCRWCYGKGFSTQNLSTVEMMNFCSCERGLQLRHLMGRDPKKRIQSCCEKCAPDMDFTSGCRNYLCNCHHAKL